MRFINRKGQASIIEHIMVIFFLVVIVIALIILLTGFQLYQVNAEGEKAERDRALTLTKIILNSRYFTRETSMFDDGKMEAVEDIIECDDLESVFGKNWFFELKVLEYGIVTDEWMINSCSRMDGRNFSYTIPVNIYRVAENKNDIGILKVGVFING